MAFTNYEIISRQFLDIILDIISRQQDMLSMDYTNKSGLVFGTELLFLTFYCSVFRSAKTCQKTFVADLILELGFLSFVHNICLTDATVQSLDNI